MVCLGNICRSPLAEGILKDKCKQHGISVKVDSAGTSNFHVGEMPDKRSMENALMHNIDISALRGRQFKVKDFDVFDMIYVMDESNYQNVIALARNQNDIDKVDYILNQIQPNINASVPDPYYGGEHGFENVFQLLNKSCNAIVEKLLSNTNQQ